MVVKTSIWVPIRPTLTQRRDRTFKKVAFVGSFGVHGGVQAPGKSRPQSSDPDGGAVARVCDGPHVITAEAKGSGAWASKHRSVKGPKRLPWGIKSSEVKKVKSRLSV